jgi:hypothetical protein
MAIFKLTARNGQAVIVRARCLSCARTVAADNAGAEGTLIWRDPEKSTVELVRPDDRPGLILRTELRND